MNTHIFYDSQNGNTDFLEHFEALPGIKQSDILGCGNDHSARNRHLLRKR